MHGKSGKQVAFALARKAAQKKASGDSNPKLEESNMSDGGTCYACGGKVGMSQGEALEYMPEEKQGGGVDEAGSESLMSDMDSDGDNDDLVYSPEEGKDDEKRSKFLKAYMVHRNIRK
jgi:hypothetical protein